MYPYRNPFSPGAGAPPPELVGRDPIVEEALLLLGRIKRKRHEKSMLLTGLRGVGKTVLLNVIEQKAREEGYRTIFIEAHEGKSLGALIVPHLWKLLFEMDRMASITNKIRRCFSILRGFVSGLKVTVNDVTIGLDIEPERGTADSGDLEIDLPNLFVALGEAAEESNSAIAIFIDEIQYLSLIELGALIMAMHKIQQRCLPLVILGAGLPILPGLAGQSKSYAERLLNFPDIGALSESETSKALNDPAREEGAEFEPSALAEIYRMTKGYPYFLQEWGYQSWFHAKESPITLEDVRFATKSVIGRLDKNFFRVRFDRLIPSEKSFLRAMAELGPGLHRTGDIAEVLHQKITSLAPVRSKLIKKGMIYSPAHGEIAFTVPLFDEFMIRAIPKIK
ncbi:MAG: ATP-binding protein [Verrucomicrobia bacterium]|nr:ATP-binding protein [Verrucomicrobiota bacterium]